MTHEEAAELIRRAHGDASWVEDVAAEILRLYPDADADLVISESDPEAA
jgi:hypothetical protein